MNPHPLQPLVGHLEKAESGNSERVEFLQQEIIGKNAGPESLGSFLTGLLGGAVSLARACEGLPHAPSQEVSRMVVRLVQLARNEYRRGVSGKTEAAAEDAAHPSPTAEMKITKPAGNLNAMELGDVLVQLGFLSEVKREEVRAHAGREACTEEEALLAMGYTSQEDLQRARDLREMLGKAQPDNQPQAITVSPTLLGEILVECGRVERSDLEAALEVQAKEGGLLGNVLVDLAAVSWDDIAHALREQGKLSASA